MGIHYHPGKANVVADALSRKAYCNAVVVQPTLVDQVVAAQRVDPGVSKIKESIMAGRAKCFVEDEHGVVWFGQRLVVPRVVELRNLILREAHDSPLSIHPGATKMYQDLRQTFWWTRMKREIARFVAECDVCRRVKAEHQRPAGLLQPLPVPEWKWDSIGMDFIVGLPRTPSGKDSIWVIIDRLTKVAHFLPVHTTFKVGRLADLYVSRVVSLHGVPKTIISDRGSAFTSQFWHSLQEAMGTRLSFSTAYHPQTDGQTERVNQVLEDMLRACILSYGKNWEKCLPFAEFSYNNSFQASLGMAPFEALYGRKCRTPLNWSETGERAFFGPDSINEAEGQVQLIRDRLRTAQSRQKSYADHRRRELSFDVDDFVYLKVSPLKGHQRFGVKGKLAPRYVGPYRIVEKIGAVAYRLELPAALEGVHDVFHVSHLKKCLRVPTEEAPLESLDVQENLTYREHPVRILEESERRTRNQTVKLLRVQWSNHSEDEATWEREDRLRADYPSFFAE